MMLETPPNSGLVLTRGLPCAPRAAQPHVRQTRSIVGRPEHACALISGELQPVFEALLAGGAVERPLDENVALGELTEQEGALWSLLVFSGYLNAQLVRSNRESGEGRPDVTILPREGGQAGRRAGAQGGTQGPEDARGGAARGPLPDRGARVCRRAGRDRRPPCSRLRRGVRWKAGVREVRRNDQKAHEGPPMSAVPRGAGAGPPPPPTRPDPDGRSHGSRSGRGRRPPEHGIYEG
jgi:hypothetical protein